MVRGLTSPRCRAAVLERLVPWSFSPEGARGWGGALGRQVREHQVFVTGEAWAGALVTGLPSRFSSPCLLFVSFCSCVVFHLGLLGDFPESTSLC